MSDEMINKVALSALLSIDLADFYPKQEITGFDLKPLLFMELILKEKDFRASLHQINWSQYQDKIVAVSCSTDAIIPVWAYMLIASALEPYAADVVFGDRETALKQVFLKNLQAIRADEFTDQRIVVKGCGDLPIGEFAYLEITKKLRPVVKSIFYGEPCSTVPIFKKK